MSIGSEIILEAGQEIGIHSLARPMDSETIIKGMNKLNGMLRSWKSLDVDLSTVQLNVPSDVLSEPLDARNAIVLNLALLMAGPFSNGRATVSPELRINAAVEKNYVFIYYRNFDLPDKVASATLPVGAGNSKGIQPQVFKGDGGIISDVNP